MHHNVRNTAGRLKPGLTKEIACEARPRHHGDAGSAQLVATELSEPRKIVKARYAGLLLAAGLSKAWR